MNELKIGSIGVDTALDNAQLKRIIGFDNEWVFYVDLIDSNKKEGCPIEYFWVIL